MPTRTRYLIAAILIAAALALAFALVTSGGDNEVRDTTKMDANLASYKGFAGRSPLTTTTTEAPIAVTEAPVSSPSPTSAEPQPTVPPAERPQSFTDSDDGAAWNCLAILESGNGTTSRNLYGIMDSRASGMSAADQLTYARRIRDDYGTYLVGWPETGAKCGLG